MKKLTPLFFAVLATSSDSLIGQELQPAFSAAAEKALRYHQTALGDRFPFYTNETGNWVYGDAISWGSGFYPGIFYLLYDVSEDLQWAVAGAIRSGGLASVKDNTSTHDLGFILQSSYGRAHQIFGGESREAVLKDGANSLASRFYPAAGVMKSWDWVTSDPTILPVIADNMMNLELLLYAAALPGGQALWKDMAISHADVTAAEIVRADGSVYHVVDFDSETGAVLRKWSHQGYSTDSTWSRAQAWVIYGYTMVHRYTGEERFLQLAQDTADWYLEHLPADYIPFWDFDSPDIPLTFKDSSAAAIVASALLELSQVSDLSEEDSLRYWSAAIHILQELVTGYLADSGMDSILDHGCYNVGQNLAVDAGLSWGDYYFVEAIQRYLSITQSGPFSYWKRLNNVQNGPSTVADALDSESLADQALAWRYLTNQSNPSIELHVEGDQLTATFQQRRNAWDGTVRCEYSLDLVTWYDASEFISDIYPSEAFSDVEVVTLGVEYTGDRFFLRLVASSN